MRDLESSFSHITTVVHAIIFFIYRMYISNTSIYTWGLHGNFTGIRCDRCAMDMVGNVVGSSILCCIVHG